MNKYIVFEFIRRTNPFDIVGDRYERHEIKTDKELKDFLFKHKDNLSNLEVFSKVNKCKIEFNVILEEEKRI